MLNRVGQQHAPARVDAPSLECAGDIPIWCIRHMHDDEKHALLPHQGSPRACGTVLVGTGNPLSPTLFHAV